MKKKYYVYGMMMLLLAGCSSNDDLLVEKPLVPDVEEENVTREVLMGDIPIEFASIGGSATVEMTRGSSNVNGAFQSGTMGIYCIGAKKINETNTVLSDVANKMKDSIQTIGNQIDQFKV